MIKTRILLLQNELSSYNVPVYNIIAEHYDLTVGYYLDDKSKQECRFEKKQFQMKRLGSLTLIKGLRKYAKDFDLVCIIPDMHVVSYCLLPFMPHKYKVINWSIGFRVSYYHPYITSRKHVYADKVFHNILSKCDASIFYMKKSMEFWEDTNFDVSRVFVAPNTTEVVPIDIRPEAKTNIIFVGTLYRGKGVDLLLASYKDAIKKTTNRSKLVIIGGGEMFDELQQYVRDNDMTKSVEFTGPIYDETMLSKQFQNALLCVSPTQGGLTCPKSMGYGVPFVCRRDAITGGEIYHMDSGVNGIMYDKDSDLTDILIDAIDYPARYVEMGIKAKEYYDNNATIKHMAQGAICAINYVLSK